MACGAVHVRGRFPATGHSRHFGHLIKTYMNHDPILVDGDSTLRNELHCTWTRRAG